MKLIISEKAIAGKRIASILSKNKFKTVNEGGVNTFSFEKDGVNHLIIPLRGHINTVNFFDGNTYWNLYDLDLLAAKRLVYFPTQKNIITALKKKRELKEVIIATDADREGEAIGVEAFRYVEEKNKDFKLKRAYFSALTDKEVTDAFQEKNLKKVDFNYASSVFARQEIDLLWGAILTRYLSVVANRKGRFFLSAGRVQTPLLNFIVERELERNAFVPEKYIEIDLTFLKSKIKFVGNHKNGKMFDLNQALAIYEKIKLEKIGIVKTVNKRERTLRRPAPFNTTSFLRAAAAIGINTSQAMMLAESLYQQGYISYPRTDNTVYPQSLDFLGILKTLSNIPNKDIQRVVAEIEAKPINPSRGKKQTTDHPPIHPVAYSAKMSGNEKKIYDLIVRRFLATLYIDARTENISAIIDVKKEPFIVNGQRILEQGWKKIYIYSKLNEVILPELKVGDEVDIVDCKKQDKETTPPDRYTEGGLIKLMEDQNLGTKSTRPMIIKKLKDRSYIEGGRSINATNIAIAVCSVLNEHCELITKPKMTADIENEMEMVAAGKKEKEEVVNETRTILKDIIKILMTEKDQIAQELRQATRNDNVLGKCVLCNSDLIVRISRNNKQFAACSGYPKCRNTFPLPQKYKVKETGTVCEECKYPIIKILSGRGGVDVCLNHKCKIRIEQQKEYEQRVAEREEKKKEKEAKKEKKEIPKKTKTKEKPKTKTTTKKTEKKEEKTASKEKDKDKTETKEKKTTL